MSSVAIAAMSSAPSWKSKTLKFSAIRSLRTDLGIAVWLTAHDKTSRIELGQIAGETIWCDLSFPFAKGPRLFCKTRLITSRDHFSLAFPMILELLRTRLYGDFPGKQPIPQKRGENLNALPGTT